MRYLLLILLLSSCTVPRLTAPTVDDLAGAPMIMWPYDHLHHDAEITVCDHVWIHIATPARDSTIAYLNFDGMVTTLEYRKPPDSIKVIADRPCICLYCHITNKCF